MTDVRKVALARSFQNIAFRQLEEKLVLALSWCQQNLRKGLSLEHVVVSGGVASNAFTASEVSQLPLLFACLLTIYVKTTDLNDALKQHFPTAKTALVFPPPSLCTGTPSTTIMSKGTEHFITAAQTTQQ